MRFSRNSLAYRLLFSVVLWVGIGTISIGFLVSDLFRWNLVDTFHVEMQEHFVELEGLTHAEQNGQPKLVSPLSDPRFLAPGSGFYWQIERPGFRTLASPSLGRLRLPGDIAKSAQLDSGWQRGPTGMALIYGRTLGLSDGRPPARLLMATDRRLIDEMMYSFNHSLASALAAIGCVMLLGGLWHVSYTLVPLRRLSTAIGDIRQGRTERMDGKFPAEVQPLVDDLNDLLETREKRAAHHRLRASNLAHGLRTPLTVLMGEADQLQANGHIEAAQVIIGETQRMQRHIDYHLARARTAIDQPKLGVETSLHGALAQLVPAMTRLHQSRNIAFLIDTEQDVVLRCDPADLLEMLSNLLDNAGKWASAACQISWQVDGGLCRIAIQDDGSGLDPALAKKLFEPGERLDDTQPGSGLGLAITRELAAQYGGKVALESPVKQGCIAVLSIPLAGKQAAKA